MAINTINSATAEYDVYICGTGISPSSINNGYIAKYNTRGNLTEIFMMTQSKYTEACKGITIDTLYQQIIVAMEVDTSYYEGVSHNDVDFQFSRFTPASNKNIILMSFSMNLGKKNWITMLGDKGQDDYFAGFKIFGQWIYLAVNTKLITYSTTANDQDGALYQINLFSGLPNPDMPAPLKFGSTGKNNILDLYPFYLGVLVLMEIDGSELNADRKFSAFATDTSTKYIALAYFTDTPLNLYDLKYYDPTVNRLTSSPPTKLFVVPKMGSFADIILVGRSSTTLCLYQNAGGSDNFFTTPSSGNCEKSAAHNPDLCISCSTGVLSDQKCDSSSVIPGKYISDDNYWADCNSNCDYCDKVNTCKLCSLTRDIPSTFCSVPKPGKSRSN